MTPIDEEIESARSLPGYDASSGASADAEPSAAWLRAPWVVTDDIYIEDAAGFLVADFAPGGVFGPGHTAAAHLAAAAPDLLEALACIAAAHLPDQPAALDIPDYDYALRHIRELRRVARDAVAKVARSQAGTAESPALPREESENPNPSNTRSVL